MTLKSKADLSYLNEEMERIKALINQLASSGKDIQVPLLPTGPQLSSSEIAELKGLLARVSALEDKTKNLDVDKIMKMLASLQENKADKADLDKFYKDLNAKFEQLFK